MFCLVISTLRTILFQTSQQLHRRIFRFLSGTPSSTILPLTGRLILLKRKCKWRKISFVYILPITLTWNCVHRVVAVLACSFINAKSLTIQLAKRGCTECYLITCDACAPGNRIRLAHSSCETISNVPLVLNLYWRTGSNLRCNRWSLKNFFFFFYKSLLLFCNLQ
jgi:hypothetical protein